MDKALFEYMACEKKIQHEKVKTARKEVKRLNKLKFPQKFNFYKCEFCRKFHVGKIKRSNRGDIR